MPALVVLQVAIGVEGFAAATLGTEESWHLFMYTLMDSQIAALTEGSIATWSLAFERLGPIMQMNVSCQAAFPFKFSSTAGVRAMMLSIRSFELCLPFLVRSSAWRALRIHLSIKK